MIGYDAVLLAGGRAMRLGGVDKAALEVGGVPILDRVLAAVAGAHHRIVVGAAGGRAAGCVVTREQPPGGGPVAAIAAGIAHVTAPVTVVLAADLPFLTALTVDAIRAAIGRGADVAVLLDASGRDQLLVSAWRTTALRARLAALGDPAGQSVRALFETATAARVASPDDAGQPPPWWDCDTDDDLRQAREWA